MTVELITVYQGLNRVGEKRKFDDDSGDGQVKRAKMAEDATL